MNLAIKAKAKEIKLKGAELESSVLATLRTLSDVVGSTLGPGGNPVLIERPGLSPLITKDGVTVAVHVAFKDALQYVIGEAAKEASLRTNREAGDGTTTAVVLAEAITRHGIQWLKEHPDKSPQEVCRELNKTGDRLAKFLKKRARKVKNNRDLRKVALVSANFDSSIADVVVEAIDAVGNDGTIITEEGNGRDTFVQLQEGFPVKKGLRSFGPIQEVFINDSANQERVLNKPLILLYNGDVNDFSIATYLGKCFEAMAAMKEVRPILIVAHKFSPQLLQLFAVNLQQGMQMIPLETPTTAQQNSKHLFLQDLAAFTGATVMDPMTQPFEKFIPDEESEPEDVFNPLGSVARVRIARDQAILFDPLDDNKPNIKERVEVLKGQMKGAESEYDAEIIKERIGNLNGGIATVFVGGSSELEMKEKKDRIIDAICAIRSAIDMGILPGGGATLLALSDILYYENSNKQVPADILADALREPFFRILSNSGMKEADIEDAATVVLHSAKTGGVPKVVYDSFQHVFVKPYAAGIVDPVKVTISALTNALSIAQMLMTVGGAIVLPRDLTEERAAEMQAQAVAAQMQGA